MKTIFALTVLIGFAAFASAISIPNAKNIVKAGQTLGDDLRKTLQSVLDDFAQAGDDISDDVKKVVEQLKDVVTGLLNGKVKLSDANSKLNDILTSEEGQKLVKAITNGSTSIQSAIKDNADTLTKDFKNVQSNIQKAVKSG